MTSNQEKKKVPLPFLFPKTTMTRQRQHLFLQFRYCFLLLVFLLVFTSTDVEAQGEEGGNSCDDSKCRATRIHPWVDNDTEWTCYVSPGTDVRDLCPDGLEGRIIPNSLTQTDGVDFELFTCCALDYVGPVEQTCSDIACSSPDWEGGGNCWGDGFQDPMTCRSAKYRFPRRTGMVSLIYVQYVCCTSPAGNAGKSDSSMRELFIARIIWMALSAITLFSSSIFIGGILRSPNARSQGYNLYLVFLAIPDALANLMILVRNGLTVSNTPAHPTVHVFLVSYEYFYASSNMWLNAVIVGQIHQVLRKSKMCVKIAPLSVKTVFIQAGLTYAWSSLWFAWAFILYSRALVWFSLPTVVNIWIITRALIVGPPLLYLIGVCVHIWKYKLLPRSGRTRVLSLYFLRVVIVFLVTWVPYFVIFEIAFNVTFSRFMVYISYYLGSIQGFLSVVVAMSKPDVKRAVYQFLCCRKPEAESKLIPFHNWWKKKGTGLTCLTTKLASELNDVDSMDDTNQQSNVESRPDHKHHERDERQARVKVNPLKVISSNLQLARGEDEWEAEDVWEESVAARSNGMSANIEEKCGERRIQDKAAEDIQTWEQEELPVSTS
uniref:Uncharacterized protein n=1 Tax=Ditylum brightwellii TaxID=49249 RepID=A0A7S1YVF3_9STRA|mmetsp:Transcript_18254/g.27262  ORF Transcript_18254/g.27262 Transcript_18254/m.27262 type:complete len:604 (+) Transcript_18254:54-1865(+)